MVLFLILLGAAAVYMLQNRLYEKNWKKGLTASVEFSQKQVVKGETVNLVEVIINGKWLPLLMVRLKFVIDRELQFTDMEDNFNVSDKCYKNDVFSLLFYQKITRTIPFVCKRRGFYTITEADLVSSNLFLNVQYVEHIPVYTELIVYPELADGDKLEIPFKKIMGEFLTRKRLYSDPFEFIGIRDYTSNDTMSSINWKASAKTGDLKVNVHGNTSSQEICILLNLETETNWEGDFLREECISIAAGLCNKFAEANVAVKLISNGCDLMAKDAVAIESGVTSGHLSTVLTSLARIDMNIPMEPFENILESYEMKETNDTLYVMISVACGHRVQKAYEKLASKHNGAMWIIPYSYKPEFEIKLCPSVEVFPWEVTANEQ